MKLKSLVFICCLGLMSHLFADTRHSHPKADAAQSSTSLKNTRYPGYCEIEIINSSFDDVTVYGTFDDGSNMQSFNIYSLFDSPHYISLFYYGYCHRDMWLDIVTYNGYHVYSGFTRPDTTVRIVPYLAKQVKAEIKTK